MKANSISRSGIAVVVVAADSPLSFVGVQGLEFDALVGLLAGVDPVVVDVDGLGEVVRGGVVELLADVADGGGDVELEVDGAGHAAGVVAEGAAEGDVQLGRRFLPGRHLGAHRLALRHLLRSPPDRR